jgi:hypothetical protein
MEKKDKRRFVELMMAMGEVFEKVPSEAKTEIYFQALKHLSIEQVSQACSEIVKTRKITGTFPLPAEIIDLAGGSIEDQALLAWRKLLWAMEYVGHGNSVAFDDPVLMGALVVWTGGWRAVRDLDWRFEQEQWRQKEFVAAYKAASRNKIRHPEYFIGDYEHDNEMKGFYDYIPKPFLVTGIPGDFAKIPGPEPKVLPETKRLKALPAG